MSGLVAAAQHEVVRGKSGFRLMVMAVFCALLFACSEDDEPQATPTPALPAMPSATSTPEVSPTATLSPTPEPTATPLPRPDANPFPADLQAEANALLAQIAAARGVTEPEAVDMFLLTREQARAFYDSDDDEAMPDRPTPTPGPRPLDPRQELYELLGLVPEVVEGTDTPTADEQALDNLISIITGFYDPSYRAFYMIDTINGGIYGSLARSTIVHELTHALQYQNADLNRIAGERGGNFDARTALLSVIEGDAVNSEIEVLGFSTRSTLRQPTCFEIPPQRNPASPVAIERELDVWYEDGLCFVQAVADRLPGGISDLFENMPSTMEQILHPEKYLASEGAAPVSLESLEAALGDSWQLLSSGTFGEFGLQNILLNGLPEDRVPVQEGAAGWGGDAWNLYVAGDSRLAHLETVWDTPEDAPQFRDALVASLEALGFSAQAEGTTTRLSKGKVMWSLAARGDGVTVVVSNDAGAMTKAEETLGLR
jgi:hypothetical protein